MFCGLAGAALAALDACALPGRAQPQTQRAALLLCAADTACQVLIVRNRSLGAWEQLHLEELRLLDASGTALPPSSVSISMSSQSTGAPASNCNDGVVGSGAMCASLDFADDPSPFLAASYPCSVALSGVVVHNRQSCCMARIKSYQLQHWVLGQLARQEPFLGTKRLYSFELGALLLLAGDADARCSLLARCRQCAMRRW
jgi:hypothetical protein